MEKEKNSIVTDESIINFVKKLTNEKKYPDKIEEIKVEVHPIFSRNVL